MTRAKKEKLSDIDASKIKSGVIIESKTTGNCGKIVSITVDAENKWHSEVVVEWDWGGKSKVDYGMLEGFCLK